MDHAAQKTLFQVLVLLHHVAIAWTASKTQPVLSMKPVYRAVA
jgi:hypothetical protein